MEAEMGVMRLLASESEEAARSQGMQATLEAGKGREMASFLEPPEATPSF